MIFAKSYYRHKQFQFDLMTKRNLKWQIIKVCCSYRNFFGHAARKVEGICKDKKMKIFAMTKGWKYLKWQQFENICYDKKIENICTDKSLKIFAMTKSWKYLQWQKVENICNDKKLKIFGGQTVAVLLGHSTDGQHLRGISWLQSNYFFFKIYKL